MDKPEDGVWDQGGEAGHNANWDVWDKGGRRRDR